MSAASPFLARFKCLVETLRAHLAVE